MNNRGQRRLTPYPRITGRKRIGVREKGKATGGEEEKGVNSKIPAKERLNLQGFDVGVEHASGWSINNEQPKPKQPDPEESMKGADALIVRDAGEVNRVQYERIKELNMPLSDTAAQALPVTIRSGNAPDFKSRDPSDDVPLSTTLISPPKLTLRQFLNEGEKMGLDNSNTNALHDQQAKQIRRLDRRVGREVRSEMAISETSALSASDIIKGRQEGRERLQFTDKDRSKFNPLVAAGQTYAAFAFRPSISTQSSSYRNSMPGSTAAAFIERDDSMAGDTLEQIVTTNPDAVHNLIDKGTFSPEFRNLVEYPAILRRNLKPSNKATS